MVRRKINIDGVRPRLLRSSRPYVLDREGNYLHKFYIVYQLNTHKWFSIHLTEKAAWKALWRLAPEQQVATAILVGRRGEALARKHPIIFDD